MGHKTHPLGFRLGIIQEDKSLWYNEAKLYASTIKQDYMIRDIISKLLRVKRIISSGITKIVIHRNERKKIYIEIQTAIPGRIVGKGGGVLKALDEKLSSVIIDQEILINIVQVKDPYTEATLLAAILVKKLEERVSFRKAMKEIVERYETQSLKGIKVQISGRLNGAEIARTQWIREGRVPLQTLRADIDYCSTTAQTKYGILGVKIWLFKDEILEKNLFN
uniref:Small ribosomal subunit protein uS3c n=1 Tax=Ishige okamurae TaxID=233772 RepID=A0A8E5XRJ9_9PHAE|nr:ribosomal protein S3 [Ishige okamurae]QVJ99698.1 ribosomal protein S3 [Ishige okamurae]WAM63994.1 30S ribosomal protein S3 [Ishige okamurae]